MAKANLYSTLGIRKNATPATIQKAYRKRALAVHPDRNPGDPSAVERMNAVQIAYDVLMDKERRVRYDATGETGDGPNLCQVMAAVHSAFEAVAAMMMKQNAKPSNCNVVDSMRLTIGAGMKAYGNQVKELMKCRKFLSDVIGRFDGERVELLDGMVKADIVEIDRLLANVGKAVAESEAAMKFLESFSFRCDACQRKEIQLTTGGVAYTM